MTGTSSRPRPSALRRGVWILYGLTLGLLGLAFGVGLAGLHAGMVELERGSGRVEPARLESLRSHNETLGRDPKLSASRFQQQLLQASIRSLPWNDYFREPSWKRVHALLVAVSILTLVGAAAAFSVAAGREGARWAVLLIAIVQLLLAAWLVSELLGSGPRILDDIYSDLRIRQDEVASAIGTQAPLDGFDLPRGDDLRTAGFFLFFLVAAPWHIGMLMAPLTTRRRVRSSRSVTS